MFAQAVAVPRELARVSIEVFVFTELKTIDENRCDERGGIEPCAADEFQMPLVQCPHRRDEPDRALPLREGRSNLGNAGRNLHGAELRSSDAQHGAADHEGVSNRQLDVAADRFAVDLGAVAALEVGDAQGIAVDA